MTAVLGFDSFGEHIAQHLGALYIKIERRVFPDSEVCPRITHMPDDVQVIVANRLALPLNPNSYLVETLLTVKNLAAKGIAHIDVVMPYFVYGRQDKVFREGEPFSARYVLEMLRDAGAERVFTVSSHANRNQDIVGIADIPVYNINGFVAIGNYLKAKQFREPLVIGPDKGAEGFVKTVAGAIGCGSALFEKERDLVTGDVIMKGGVAMKGRDVILVDDIIGSGGTMLKAIDLCRDAHSVYCAVVHLVSDKRVGELQAKTKEFAVTNTIDSPNYPALAKVSVEALIAEKIREVSQ